MALNTIEFPNGIQEIPCLFCHLSYLVERFSNSVGVMVGLGGRLRFQGRPRYEILLGDRQTGGVMDERFRSKMPVQESCDRSEQLAQKSFGVKDTEVMPRIYSK